MRLAIVLILTIALCCLLVWSLSDSPETPPAPPPATIPVGPDERAWDLGTLAEALAGKGTGENLLAGITSSERERVMRELSQFRIIAVDRLKPTGRYFKDDEPPSIRILRSDASSGSDSLETEMTATIEAKPRDSIRVEAEQFQEGPWGYSADDIWEKTFIVSFHWTLKDGEGLKLSGVLRRAKGFGFAWRTQFVVKLPHPTAATVRTSR